MALSLSVHFRYVLLPNEAMRREGQSLRDMRFPECLRLLTGNTWSEIYINVK